MNNLRTNTFSTIISSSPSSISIISPGNATPNAPHGEYEAEEDRSCAREAYLDKDFLVVPERVTICDIGSISVSKIETFLKTQITLEGRDKKTKLPTGKKTAPFTLSDMLKGILARIELTDIQWVGSSVDAFMDTPSNGANFADYDWRLCLKNASQVMFETIIEVVVEFIADRLVDVKEDGKIIVNNQFFTKKYFKRTTNISGDATIEYVILGIAPMGMRPIDILITRKLARQYLFTKDYKRISFMGLLDAQSMTRCTLIEQEIEKVVQADVDRKAKILRFDGFEALDYITVLPSLISSYLRGYRLFDLGDNNTERKLVDGLRFECDEVAKNLPKYDPMQSWDRKIISEQQSVEDKKKAYILVFAEGIYRAIKGHVDDKPGVYIAGILMACRLLQEEGSFDHADIFWKECGRKEAKETPGLLGVIRKLIDGDIALLRIMIPWLELHAITQMYRTDADAPVPIRHRKGFGVRIVIDGASLLWPLDPSDSCKRMINAWSTLNRTQKGVFEKFCIDHHGSTFKDRPSPCGIAVPFFDQALQMTSRAARIIFDVHFLSNVYPDFSWFEANWEALFSLYDSKEACLRMLKSFQGVYNGVEEQKLILALEKMYQDPKNAKLSHEAMKQGSLFMIHSDRRHTMDLQDWQKKRTGLPDRVKFDRACCERIVPVRPDIAAEILMTMLTDKMSIKDAEPFFAEILRLTLAQPDPKRSWTRLGKLLKEMSKGKTGHSKVTFSAEVDKTLLDLSLEMVKNDSYSKEFVENALRLIDHKNCKPESIADMVGVCLDQGKSDRALEIWNLAEQYKLWKPPFPDRVVSRLVKLTLTLRFSAQHIQLYRHLLNAEEALLIDGSKGLVDSFFQQLFSLPDECSHDEVQALMIVLRTPLVCDFLARKKTGYGAPIYKRIVTPSILKANPLSTLFKMESMDFVDGMICLGHWRNKSVDEKKWVDRISVPVRALYQANFIVEATELLRCLPLQRKMFSQPSDPAMLKEIILETQDIILYLQCKQLPGVEIPQAESWVLNAPLSLWQSVWNAQNIVEQNCRAFWPYLCQKVKMGHIDDSFLLVIYEALKIITKVDRKRLVDMLSLVDVICGVQNEAVTEMLLFLFTNSLENQTDINQQWKARLAVGRLLDKPFGKDQLWYEFDKNLSIASVRVAHCEHHTTALAILVKCIPSPEISALLAKHMNTSNVLVYLSQVPGPEIGVGDILHHPNIVSVLSEDVSRSMPILQSCYEVSEELKLEYLSIALKLSDDNYWFNALVSCLRQCPGDSRIALLVREHYMALYKHISGLPSHEEELYLLLWKRVEDLVCEPFPDYAATAYCNTLMSSAAPSSMETAMKCIQGKLLVNAEESKEFILLLHTLHHFLEKKHDASVASLLPFLKARLEEKPLEEPILEHIKSLFQRRWCPLLQQIAALLHTRPECQSVIVTWIKTQLDDNTISSRDKLGLLVPFLSFMRLHIESEWVHEVLFREINNNEGPLHPALLDTLFSECFLAKKMFPLNIWQKLYLQLHTDKDTALCISIADRSVEYVIANCDNADRASSAWSVLFFTLVHLRKDAIKSILPLFQEGKFLSCLFSETQEDANTRYMILRLLYRNLLIALPDQLEDIVKKQWVGFTIKAESFLLSIYPRIAKMKVENRESWNSDKYDEELRIYLTFTCALNNLRFANFTGMGDAIDLSEIFLESDGSCLNRVVNADLKYLCENCSDDHRNSVMSGLLINLSDRLRKGADPLVHLAAENFMRYYSSLLPPQEFLNKCRLWVADRSTPLVKIISRLVIELHNKKQLEGLENNMKQYLHVLVAREDFLSHDDILKSIMPMNDKNIDDAKRLYLLYLERYHKSMLYKLVPNQKCGPELIAKILDFIKILQQSFGTHFKTAVISVPDRSATHSKNRLAPRHQFEKQCLRILEMLYFWSILLQEDHYERIYASLLTNVNPAYRKITSTPIECHLLAILISVVHTSYHPINSKNYRDLFKKSITMLSDVQTSIKTLKDADLFLACLEELCLMEIPLIPVETETILPPEKKSKWEDLLERIAYNAYTNVNIVSAFTEFQDLKLYKMIHSLPVPNSVFGVFTGESVWKSVIELKERIDCGSSTNVRVALNMLIPCGESKVEHTKHFAVLKTQAFIQHSLDYRLIWSSLLSSFSETQIDVHWDLLIESLNLLMDETQVKNNIWRLTVYNILILAFQTLSESSRMTWRVRLDLLHNAVSRGYLKGKENYLFTGLMTLGDLYCSELDDATKDEFEKTFLCCFSHLLEVEWDTAAAEQREELFIKFAKAYKAIPNRNDLIDSVINCLYTTSSQCFKSNREEFLRRME